MFHFNLKMVCTFIKIVIGDIGNVLIVNIFILDAPGCNLSFNQKVVGLIPASCIQAQGI